MDSEYSARLLRTVSAAATNEPSDPQTVLHAVYSAVIEGDFEALGGSLTDDVELSIGGFAPMDGTWKGRSEVIKAIERNFALVDAQQPEIRSMISQGDSTAVLLRESGVIKSTGEAYNMRVVQWFTFAAGKIRKIDEIAGSIPKTN